MPQTLRSGHEFLQYQPRPIIPIIKNRILPLQSFMILWGDFDTWKSWLMLDLGWSVAQGEPWIIFGTNKYNVLLLNTELPEDLYHERWAIMTQTRKSCPDNFYTVHDSTIKLDTPQGQAQLSQWIENSGAKLVIIDNLYRTFSGDINNGVQANKMLDTFNTLRDIHGCSFAIVHHSRKTSYDIARQEVIRRGAEDLTGSKYLANNMATIFESRKVTIDGIDRAIQLIPEKMWFEATPPPPLNLAVVDTQFTLVSGYAKGGIV